MTGVIGVMGVIGVAGAGQTLGGEKEMKREKKWEDRQRMNKQGKIGRLSHQYHLEG